jgi:hypothetical protein
VPGGAVAVGQLVQAGQDKQEAEHDPGQAAQQQELLKGRQVQGRSSRECDGPGVNLGADGRGGERQSG